MRVFDPVSMEEIMREFAEENAAVVGCLTRVAQQLGIDMSSGEWPAVRLAMRIEQRLKRGVRT